MNCKPCPRYGPVKAGAPGMIRTCDLRVRSPNRMKTETLTNRRFPLRDVRLRQQVHSVEFDGLRSFSMLNRHHNRHRTHALTVGGVPKGNCTLWLPLRFEFHPTRGIKPAA